MHLFDYAVSMLTRPSPPAQRRGHPMTPAVTPPTAVMAPAGPTDLGEASRGPASCASSFGALADAAAAALHRCEEITTPMTDNRPYPILCANLPRGHTGRCEPFPSAYRMAVEWHAVMAKRIEGLELLEAVERP